MEVDVKTLAKNLVIVLVAMAAGAAIMVGYLNTQPSPTLVTRAASAAPVMEPVAHSIFDESTIANIYESLSQSVVNITSTSKSGATAVPRRSNPFGSPPNDQPQRGSGSGVIIDAQGNILTNNHVVEGASKIDVTLANGNTVPGKVLGTDPGNDLAVVQIDPSGQSLVPALLGDSNVLKVGQLALAIGNPFGLERTLTVGIVSSLGRTFGTGTNGRPIRDMIQTDAAINPGNSGGPLINSRGEVIGINSQIESPVGANVGIGFAVPINTAKASLLGMIAGKTLGHPWLGISGTSLTPPLASQLNIPAEGVYVAQVLPNSPAAAAGLKGSSHAQSDATATPAGGDVILSVDGKKVGKVEEISSYLDTLKVGDSVTITIRRDGQTRELKAVVADWPSNGPQ
jgi:S1-C subfamily serine protease